MKTAESKNKVVVFWFRRDLRMEDNTGLQHALASGCPVLPLFILDTEIVNELEKNDARITFIHQELGKIHNRLLDMGSSLQLLKGKPLEVWKDLTRKYIIRGVFVNRDYEPYALQRDREVASFLASCDIPMHTFKDQLIFEGNEILKKDGLPYTVFTPYKRRWLERYREHGLQKINNESLGRFLQETRTFPQLAALGFTPSEIRVAPYDLSGLKDYARWRDFPSKGAGTGLGPHLRFGTVSIRKIMNSIQDTHEVFLSELIWREFFMQILFHFPRVVSDNFHRKYDGMNWLNKEEDFDLWCQGLTGYPLVDAGMRELNQTGYMQNRVRMVTASFLCKHLLVDWQQGEAYFASKLLDYELSSNNGNWQWAAGTGCDAAPYFRVFNPAEQLRKFDGEREYVKKWVPEYGTDSYPVPMVDHRFARQRAIETYKKALIAA